MEAGKILDDLKPFHRRMRWVTSARRILQRQAMNRLRVRYSRSVCSSECYGAGAANSFNVLAYLAFA